MSRFAQMLDNALEASVIGSFTRAGYAARRALWRWDQTPLPRLDGRVVVITGATSGIGLAAAHRLCALGASLELVARDARKAEATLAALRRLVPTAQLGVVLADMGSLADVRRAAELVASRHQRVDVLIQNAGALDDHRSVSPEGIETTIATHLVGPYLLTRRLLPLLRSASSGAGDAARVIWVTSGGMYTEALDVGQLEMPASDYDGVTAYARAKRAQMTLVEILANELPPGEVVVHAMHPGWADTPGVARSLPRFRAVLGPVLRTPEQGADTLVYLAAAGGAPLARSGQLWLDRHVRPAHRSARTRRADTPEARAQLLAWLEARCEAHLASVSLVTPAPNRISRSFSAKRRLPRSQLGLLAVRSPGTVSLEKSTRSSAGLRRHERNRGLAESFRRANHSLIPRERSRASRKDHALAHQHECALRLRAGRGVPRARSKLLAQRGGADAARPPELRREEPDRGDG